jgi:hypothetical protein
VLTTKHTPTASRVSLSCIRVVAQPRSNSAADCASYPPKFRCQALSLIPAPALPFGLAQQGGEGLRFGHVPYAPARSDAAPFLHDGEAAEQIWLHVEPIEPAHVAGRLDAGKMHGVMRKASKSSSG